MCEIEVVSRLIRPVQMPGLQIQMGYRFERIV